LTNHSSLQLNGVERGKWVDDPALRARCHEAIVLRTMADDGGILLAGKIALQAKQHDEDTYVGHESSS
jgi:hypothetical protein